MSDLAVIVPSRGRPEAARALVHHVKATATGDTLIVFAVNDDDPAADEYRTVGDGVQSVVVFVNASTMVEALNKTAYPYAGLADMVGFMGDDHVPRTVGWDAAIIDAGRRLGTGIVYGNDLLQGANLPTAAFLTADIVRALGWMTPPGLWHMYADNFWLTLGRRLDRITYLPDVVIEHMHPVAGKAAVDPGYTRVNDSAVYGHDADVFADYVRTQLDADVARITASIR